MVILFINDQNFEWYEFHYNTSSTTVIFVALANMHIECVTGIYHYILLYYIIGFSDTHSNYIVVISPLMAKILTDAQFIEADITFDETREYPYTCSM